MQWTLNGYQAGPVFNHFTSCRTSADRTVSARPLRIGLQIAAAALAIFFAAGFMDSGHAQERAQLSGTVTRDGIPVCALVLANGQYMFTCGGDGRFDLTNVPFDGDGKITLYAFCNGLTPFKTSLYQGVSDYEIALTVQPDVPAPVIDVRVLADNPDKSGWVDISGTIANAVGSPLCALVLANGQYMFACDQTATGEFDMTVPLGASNDITLYGFSSGMMPFRQDITLSDLTLSESSAVPGRFIRIQDDSIQDGTALNVTFDDGGGYRVTVNTTLTENGAARVPVPPVVDLATGDFISSAMTVSIPSGARAALTVQPLPELSGWEPGGVVAMYLGHTIDNLKTALAGMDPFESTYGTDTAELKSQIQNQIDGLTASVSEIENHGRMTFYSLYDGHIVLDADDLARMDQYLHAVLDGALAERSTPSFAGPYSLTKADLLTKLRQAAGDIDDGKVILVGLGGMTITVAGALMAPEIATGATILYAFQAATASILVVGVAGEGLSAVEAALQPDDGSPGEVYQFGNALQAEGLDGIKSMAIAAGSELSDVVNLISFAAAGWDVSAAFNNMICTPEPAHASLAAYCSEWEEQYTPPDMAIKPVKFYDEVIKPGVEGELMYWVSGSSSSYVNMTVAWGDGEVTTASVRAGRLQTLNHTYSLGQADYRLYTITLAARDEAGNQAFASETVMVSDSLDPVVSFSSEPARVKTNQSHGWGLTFDKGFPPYSYTIQWGDGKTASGTADSMGAVVQVNHTYTKAGKYTLTVEVTDANQNTANATAQADARDPVSIVSVTGPTGLDLNQTGTWTVTLDGGWAPYNIHVLWQDFNNGSYTSQARQFTISHAYKDEGTYDVEVTVTDDEGDTDSGSSASVQVPQSEQTIPIRITIDCDDPDLVLPVQTATLTVDRDMVTISGDNLPNTTEIVFNHFSFTWVEYPTDDLVWTEVFEGDIDTDDATGQMTASGTYRSYMSDGSLNCSGTWSSY